MCTRLYVHRLGIALVLGALFGPAHAQQIVRGPYLQSAAPQSILVRWRTDLPTESRVLYGSAPDALDNVAIISTPTTEHEVALSALQAQTRYYYAIGTADAVLAGDDSYRFTTPPLVASVAPSRVWVLGDQGHDNSSGRAVRDAYLNFSSTRETDLWLMLGDNAYADGTDEQYQTAVFDKHPVTLRQAPLWSTLGNHDGHSASSADQSGPYYDIFSLPTQGEGGGVPSYTEAYYSFDYANVHFICLDSFDSDRTPDGPMMRWLENDLASTRQHWIVAFWHHPPYTKGTHDSDTEGSLIDMREYALPMLEDYGVDLVLTGHSHVYERSFLLDGHYGDTQSFAETMQLDSGDGREDGEGGYEKLGGPGAPHAGAVYIVAGSAASAGGGTLDHPAMFISLDTLGSLVLDIEGNRIDGTFVTDNGSVDDYFTLIKGPDSVAPSVVDAQALDATTIAVHYSETVDPVSAAQLANYTVPGLQIGGVEVREGGRSVHLTLSPMTPDRLYQLQIANVTDLVGNPIGADTQLGLVYRNLLSLSFQDGVQPTAEYAGTRDAYLDQTYPQTNYGLDDELVADGDDGGFEIASLLSWDISTMPAEAELQSAQITIAVSNESSDRYHFYRLLRSWEETAASWEAYGSNLLWQVAGADGIEDREGIVLASINASTTGEHVIDLNAEGIGVLQSWITGALLNHGFVISNGEASNGVDFASRESAATTDRPRLTLNYYLPADDDDLDGISNVNDNCSSVANVDQRDTNSDGFGNLCDADLDNNGMVDFLDLLEMKIVFFGDDADADLDGDGVVDFTDLQRLKSAVFGPPGPSGLFQ